MTKLLSRAAFGTGLLAIAWIGAGTLRTNPLTLAITLLIGAFYVMGVLELRRFGQATAGLRRALDGAAEPPAELGDWLAQVPAGLRHAVQLRIEGDRAALPGPALAPYLSGLLVLLGMLGTFLGMVVTLNGTGIALEHATDLQTMRDSLAAPVKGLGLAFGTSVAGVAASAMLGLMTALARRERLQAAHELDARIGSSLRLFTRTHQRQQALALQQQQAALMPALVNQLQDLMAQLDARALQSNAQLLAGQDQFHARADAAYRQLASSVDESLRRSVGDSARAAAATIQPLVEQTLGGIAGETTRLQQQVAGAVQQQLDGISTRFEASTHTITETWTTALARHDQASAALTQDLGITLDGFGRGFEQRTAALLETLAQSQAALAERIAGAAATQQAALLHELGQAQARLQAELATRDEQRLAAWSEAPRAAADVVAQLRDKLSESMARDNAMLEERSRIMATLDTLLDAVQHTATDQKAAIDQLLESSAAWLEQAGARFTAQVTAESARSETVAAQLTTSAVEVASLGEAFGVAVELFSQSGDKLTAQLQRVEQALGQSLARSDEQLAYYVAQAREVIDLSLMSQKQVVEDLKRIGAVASAA